METKMLIGSSFEAGTEIEEAVLNPRTGETILMLPEASQAQVDRAVEILTAAFHDDPTWSQAIPDQSRRPEVLRWLGR